MSQLGPFLQGRITVFCTVFIGLLILQSCTSSHRYHWLYQYVPENRSEIPPYNAAAWLSWAIAGNEDDGIFGEKSHHFSEEPTCQQALKWFCRNPFHNFCFYVIGSADYQQDEWDLLKITRHGCCFCHYHPKATTVFPEKSSCFYLGLHGGKIFISLRLCYCQSHRLDFYLGWRERGNFGALFQPFRKNKSRDNKIDKHNGNS